MDVEVYKNCLGHAENYYKNLVIEDLVLPLLNLRFSPEAKLIKNQSLLIYIDILLKVNITYLFFLISFPLLTQIYPLKTNSESATSSTISSTCSQPG